MRKFKFPAKVKSYMRYLTGVINNKANTLKKYLFDEKSFFKKKSNFSLVFYNENDVLARSYFR